MKKLFNSISRWWQTLCFYVIADATDNAVTLSRKLYRHMKVSAELSEARVFVFYVPATRCYAFMLNPQMEEPTQLADIQYNSKYRCIGFESLCPTVTRIFYDYGINQERCKLSVTVRKNTDGQTYYQIERPQNK